LTGTAVGSANGFRYFQGHSRPHPVANGFSSAAIIPGYFFHMNEDKIGYRIEPRQIERQFDRISASKYPLVIYKDKNLDGSSTVAD
jgi:hypothetical protein